MRRRDFGQILTRPPRPGFYARVSWRGSKVERFAGSTRAIASKNLGTLRSRLEQGADLEFACAEVFGGIPASGLTFEQASGLFLESREARVKASTYAGDKGLFRILCSAPFAKRYLADLRPVDFERWVEARLKKVVNAKTGRTVSGATCNRALFWASALFEWARKMGHVKVNPVREVEKLSEKGRAREVFLEPHEARELVSVADPVMRPVLTCAVSSGMRRGEMIRLSWRSVDLPRRILFVEPEDAKSGRTRSVPMTDDLFREVAALHAARAVNAAALEGDDPVFRQANGGRITAEVIKKGLARALRACKAIPKDKAKRITAHALRHTAGSLLAHATGDLFAVGRILGHSDPKTTLRYCHFLPQAGRDSIAKLGNVLALGQAGASEAAAQ
jgi:integrase